MTEESEEQPARIKADLHMHGPIGFQPYWLKVQGYEGKNLLREIADSCLDKGIGIVAITSDEDKIPRNSIHDRFNWLKENCVDSLPRIYHFDTLGENAGIISRTEERKKNGKSEGILYLINAQSVRARDGERQVNYNVIGTNQIPNHKSIEETIKRVNQLGLLGGAEQGNHRMSQDRMSELIDGMSFVEGHDSQLIFPFPSFTPIIGSYRRGLNSQARKLATENDKPWIAVSNAHRIEDAGKSYIEFDSHWIEDSSGDKFLQSLKVAIESRDFSQVCNYENPVGWFDWVGKFVVGVKRDLYEKI